jgi:hypothetical protein
LKALKSKEVTEGEREPERKRETLRKSACTHTRERQSRAS